MKTKLGFFAIVVTFGSILGGCTRVIVNPPQTIPAPPSSYNYYLQPPSGAYVVPAPRNVASMIPGADEAREELRRQAAAPPVAPPHATVIPAPSPCELKSLVPGGRGCKPKRRTPCADESEAAKPCPCPDETELPCPPKAKAKPPCQPAAPSEVEESDADIPIPAETSAKPRTG